MADPDKPVTESSTDERLFEQALGVLKAAHYVPDDDALKALKPRIIRMVNMIERRLGKKLSGPRAANE